jgi:amino acid adenylation domain-containing protein
LSVSEGDVRLLEHVHEAIAKHAAARPEALALGCEGRWLTYSRLNELVLAAARSLCASADLTGEGPVAVLTGRSEWAIVAMLATWRANGVYVPLAEGIPPQRLRAMLAKVGPVALLTDKDNAAFLQDTWAECPVIEIEQVAHAETGGGETTMPADPLGTRLACLIHTSGSSGPAKATMVDHRALHNLVTNVTASYAPGPGDRAFHFGAFGWDSSLEEAILPLHRGASLMIRTDQADYGVPHFLQSLGDLSITHLYLPTSYWREICLEMSRGPVVFPGALRSVLVGGELASVSDLATWRRSVPPSVEFLNCYGLTETCVTSTIYRDDREISLDQVRGVPLGTACPTVTASILDDLMNPLPVDEVGELYIGGPGVARGYWRDPSATAASFVPGPHGGERLYRTGDLARRDADGLLHFVGRADRQIKISGFRVNPGEVEGVLEDHPDVVKACVLPRTETAGHTGMIAYLELGENGSADAVRKYLEDHLQKYMTPAVIEVLPHLPVLPSGKVDVSELMSLAQAASTPRAASAQHRPDDDIEQIWCDALRIDTCGRDDDFLDLGGNSLSAMRIAARINETFGVEVRFRDILESRTIAALADLVAELLQNDPGDRRT